jgi:Ser/Thr protein kinase RdoA (MazF antagonist)
MKSINAIDTEFRQVLSHFDFDFSKVTIRSLGNGHINSTFKLTTPKYEFVLQRINHEVFANPVNLCDNAQQINQYLLEQKNIGYYPLMVPQQIQSKSGTITVKIDEDYWRLIEYINESYTLEEVSNPQQAAQVARAFAQFSCALSEFPTNNLDVIIEDFHEIAFRMRQLKEAVDNNDVSRLENCQDLVDFCIDQYAFVEQVVDISSRLPVHVTHNDTKINNLLFSKSDHSPCAVIDLDTCMPGLLMHDFGDMVRTCCSNLAEDDTCIDKMVFDFDIFEALISNYQHVLKNKINALEKDSLIVGAKLLPFIMGTRFLTDHLNGDKYYSIKRNNHNLDRAKNQIQLYKLISTFESDLIKLSI